MTQNTSPEALPPVADGFVCCDTRMTWPTRTEDRTCPDCGTVWEREPVDLGAGARIKQRGPSGVTGVPDPARPYALPVKIGGQVFEAHFEDGGDVAVLSVQSFEESVRLAKAAGAVRLARRREECAAAAVARARANEAAAVERVEHPDARLVSTTCRCGATGFHSCPLEAEGQRMVTEAADEAERRIVGDVSDWKPTGIVGVLTADVTVAADPAWECDAAQFGAHPSMLNGRCRCVVCARCGHHTGNSHQGHYWSFCSVTGRTEEFHMCCPEPDGCELHGAAVTLAATGLTAELDGTEITGRLSLAERAETAQSDPERTAYIIGLRKLADILESNPVVPLPLNSGAPYSPVLFGFHGSVAREELAAAVRAFPCAFAKDADGKWLNLDGKLAGLHVQLYASRDAVCTRRVVGTEEREVEVEVTPAVKEKRTETVEVVEWACEPILSDDKAAGR